MSRVGAIDCGTNSIRLLIADVAGGRLHELHRDMRIVRLGQGVDATGRFAPEAIARTRTALIDYTRLLARFEVADATEIDTFAFFSAIESLIPSPTKQTFRPSFWSRST